MKILDALAHEDILYLKSCENYTTYHLADGRRLMSGFTLKRHQALLAEGFVRINRSYLLNRAFVAGSETEGQNTYIRCTTGERFLVSRRRVGVIGV